MQSVWRPVLSLALVSWLAVLGVIPPEHVHEPDANHHTALTHRHFEAHDHDGTEISHGEGRIVWLDDGAVEHAGCPIPLALPAVTDKVEAVPPAPPTLFVMTLDAAPAHGPPRPGTPLRAPPASLQA